MTKPTYTPQAGSLPSQVCGYFQNNPDEELTLEDIADKFDVSRGNIHTNLGLAIANALLVRDRNADGEYIYKPGKSLPAPTKQAGINIDSGHGRTAPPPKAVVALPDPAQVAIERGVPIPNHRAAKQDWNVLLQRLQPGESALLPIAAKFTLSGAITDAHKAKQGTYTMRTLPQSQELRVWRTA